MWGAGRKQSQYKTPHLSETRGSARWDPQKRRGGSEMPHSLEKVKFRVVSCPPLPHSSSLISTPSSPKYPPRTLTLRQPSHGSAPPSSCFCLRGLLPVMRSKKMQTF